MPGPPFLRSAALARSGIAPMARIVKRFRESFRRWATWPLAGLGLIAWLVLLYLMVGDLL